jgi:hypothetical protein
MKTEEKSMDLDACKNFFKFFEYTSKDKEKNGKNPNINWTLFENIDILELPSEVLKILKDNIVDENKKNDEYHIELDKKTIQRINKILEKEELIIANRIDVFKPFQLTSKESNFNKYPKELELNKANSTVKTKDLVIDHSTKKAKGFIKTCFISPLEWLDKEHNLNLSDDLEDSETLFNIKKTGHFEVKAREEQIYNAICYLIQQKIYKREKRIFISFNEIHQQLGYCGQLRPEHKAEYEKIIYKLNFLEVMIDFTNTKYRKYKEFYKSEGNIKEPLIILVSFTKAKVKSGKTTKILEGFETLTTKLMNLHFNHPGQTNRYFTKEITEVVKNKKKIEAKNKHIPKLETYINKLYFLSQSKKTLYIDLKNETIFEELKEFKIKENFEHAKKSRHGERYLNRNIYKPIESIPVVAKIIKLENDTNRIYWNMCK